MSLTTSELDMLRSAVSAVTAILVPAMKINVRLGTSAEDLAVLGLILGGQVLERTPTQSIDGTLLLVRCSSLTETRLARQLDFVSLLATQDGSGSWVCEPEGVCHCLLRGAGWAPPSPSSITTAAREAWAWGSLELAQSRLNTYRHKLKTWLLFNERYAQDVIESPDQKNYARFVSAFADPEKWRKAASVCDFILSELSALGCDSGHIAPFQALRQTFDRLKAIVLPSVWPSVPAEQASALSLVSNALEAFSHLRTL